MRFFSNKKFIRNRTSNRGADRPRPSYYRAPVTKAPSRSPFKRKLPQKQPRRGVLATLRNGLIIFLLLAGLVYSQIVKAEPKLEVNDTSYHSVEEYTGAAKADLTALRNKTKLTLDKRGIADSLRRKFPEIANVRIDLSLFSQKPTIKLNIAAPTFNLSSGGSLYVVGANGVVATTSSSLPGPGKLPSLIDQSGFVAAPGKQVLGSQAISFINSLLAQCKQAGVKVQSLTLPPSPSELDLRTEGAAYFVKFDLNGDLLIQAGQYLAAKHKFDNEGSPPSHYLDVRVAGKIYYK